ncbi:MAG: B12-binding domain-containing radical SAM protein [Chloroflexota bacterium]
MPVSITFPPGDTPVLYVHPAKQGVAFASAENAGRSYGVIPVGVAALVNLLRENGIAVRGIDYPLEKQLNPRFSLKNWLGAHRGVRVILIDMHWYEHTYGAVDFARACKAAMPWAYTVLGGLTASGFSRAILEQCPEVDFVVRGDAERPLLALVQKILAGRRVVDTALLSDIPNLSYRHHGQIVENPLGYTASVENLDQLNFVDIDFLEHAQHYSVHEYLVTDLASARQALNAEKPFAGRWLCTARGCRYHCSYCGGSKDAHKLLAARDGVIVRSPERIADDLVRLQSQGVDQAAMSYDIAELGEAYWQTLFAHMQARRIDIGIYNEFFQQPDAEFIHALARVAGNRHTCVAVSPLSGNERVRRLNGKHYSNALFWQTLTLLRQYNFYLYVYFSLNLPGETDETFSETLGLAKKVYDFYPHHLLKILNTVHTIDPLAPMNVHPEKYGIASSMTSFADFYTYCRDTQVASPEARTGKHRGFEFKDPQRRSLARMAQAWDAAWKGREESWWPIPPSW